MSNIGAFVNVSLDGFFAGPNGEIDWFKAIRKSDDFDAYTHGAAKSGSTLLFGRTTYEMMKSYWTTPEAAQVDAHMTNVMRNSKKIVISRTLKSVEETPAWKNVELRRDIGDFASDDSVTILGSGSIVQQLANRNLVDQFQLVVVPLILGAGKPLFKDVKKIDLTLQNARSFSNGLVVLTYRPA